MASKQQKTASYTCRTFLFASLAQSHGTKTSSRANVAAKGVASFVPQHPTEMFCVLLFTYFQRDQASANTKAAILLRSRIKHGLIGPAAIFELLDGWAADEEPALKTIVDIEEPALKTIVDVEESGLEAIVDIEEPNELVEDGVDPATGLA
jgi:hypothetical protein